MKGNILNVFTGEIYPAQISMEDGIIKCVKPIKEEFKHFILPGLIDAHIHIESSMLTPSRFAEAVVPHGTTSVVSDPHEIANVMGVEGIKYMMEDASSVPLNVFFTAPSCVPATPYETAGAEIGASEINELLENDDIVALGEMMNFPGVIEEDPVIIEKIKAAKNRRKPVDGHAPLLLGDDLCRYIAAGISTDHECTLQKEALEKRRLGMKIMLREGSSAKNLEDLISSGGNFIVSDDKNPEDLRKGHLDQMLKKGVELGLDPVEAVKMVTLNPAVHYNLNTGAIAPGKVADLLLVNDLKNFNVEKVFIGGKLVAQDDKPLFPVNPVELKGSFNLRVKKSSDFDIRSKKGEERVRVMEVIEDQLVTEESEVILPVVDNEIQADIENDILKIAVMERYGHDRMANAFVRGFKLEKGAIASSVAHDSHNIIVVGTNSRDMADAVNVLAKNEGGLVATSNGNFYVLKLPVAGLMSTEPLSKIYSKLEKLNQIVKNMGCKLNSPFMIMSFMALLVIPELKISDMGLFDVGKFRFVDVVI